MSNLEITKRGRVASTEICELEYGTFITDVPSGKNCIYVKVKKKSRVGGCGKSRGLGIQWDNGNCILLNLSYGTLRQIPAKTQVTPLKPILEVSELDPRCYNTVRKGYHPDNC